MLVKCYYYATDSPTDNPSNIPTDNPSNSPSNSPSDKPSNKPSDKPSNNAIKVSWKCGDCVLIRHPTCMLSEPGFTGFKDLQDS